jgi:uncharacterized protein (UPF0333 family)
MYKKAQAAMEFLMTYGWAILVVLVAIAALAYFGVLSPNKFLPERCTLPSGIACLDHKATGGSTDTIQLQVQNGMGVDLQNVTLAVTGCTASTPPVDIANGMQASLTVTACAGVSELTTGSKFTSEAVTLAYVNKDTQISHTKTGSLTTKVE